MSIVTSQQTGSIVTSPQTEAIDPNETNWAEVRELGLDPAPADFVESETE